MSSSVARLPTPEGPGPVSGEAHARCAIVRRFQLLKGDRHEFIVHRSAHP
jgi:hypothetical protein